MHSKLQHYTINPDSRLFRLRQVLDELGFRIRQAGRQDPILSRRPGILIARLSMVSEGLRARRANSKPDFEASYLRFLIKFGGSQVWSVLKLEPCRYL